MTERIVLYGSPYSPFVQRAQIALEEVGVDYTFFDMDVTNGAPEWYISKVNPAGLVPALTYGGPQVPPTEPSPESVKIPESMVIVEFIADLFPSSGLVPTNPVERAKLRLFLDFVNTKLFPTLSAPLYSANTSVEQVLQGVESLQKILPDHGAYALGDTFTIADIAVVVLLCRLEIIFAHDLGKLPVGEAPKIYNALRNEPKYAKYRRYYDVLKKRESFKKTFAQEQAEVGLKARFARTA